MDWLKKIMDSAESTTSEEMATQILDHLQEQAPTEDDLMDKVLAFSPNVFVKFEENGKILLQNANYDGAVEFSKDVLLVIYQFFHSEKGNLPVKDFLNDWPQDSHKELLNSLKLLIGGDILYDISKKQTAKKGEAPEAISPETNIHINLNNHHYMLKDYVRLAAYRRAIENKVKPGMVAMDLGTGTGILAFFAAKAGAKKVYAIERRSDIVNISRDIAIENGLDKQVEYIIGNSTKILPSQIEEKVDVFISEILGSGIFEENVIEFTKDARDRFCKPDAQLIPAKLDVYAFGYDAGRQDDIRTEAEEVERLYNIKLTRFKNTLANFTPTRYERFNTALYKVMTKHLMTKSVDFKTVEASLFRDKLELEVTEDGNLNAFCVYFVAHLDEDTTLTNSPWAPNTHWIQKVFVMPQSLKVSKGQIIPITSVYDGDYRVELRID